MSRATIGYPKWEFVVVSNVKLYDGIECLVIHEVEPIGFEIRIL